MLELRDVHVSYGNIRALRGVSLRVGKGELVTLIGSNGAGKTTCLLTISGVLRPRQGTITYEGEEISRLAPFEIVRRGISQSPEGRHVFARLTVAENLMLGAGRHGTGSSSSATVTGCTRFSRFSWSACRRRPELSAAASSKCLPWVVP